MELFEMLVSCVLVVYSLCMMSLLFCVSLIPSQTEAGIGEEGGREQLPPPYGMEDNFALDYSDGWEG